MKQEKEPAVTAPRGTDSKKPAAVPAARARQRELRAPGNIRAFTVCDTAECSGANSENTAMTSGKKETCISA